MKKYSLIALLLICAIVMSACGKGSQEDIKTDYTENMNIANSTADSEEQTATEETSTTTPSIRFVELDLSQRQEKSVLSKGNTYIIEVSNYSEVTADGWAVVVEVGEEFDAESVTYLNACNMYMEEQNISVTCTLEGNQLIICPEGWLFAENQMKCVDEDNDATNDNTAIGAYETLYLLIESKELSDSFALTTSLYGLDSVNGIYEIYVDSDMLRKATGEVVLQDCISDFSEGLCWAEIKYKDTKAYANAIIDKAGNIKKEFGGDAFSSFGNFYNGVSLVCTHEGILQYINTEGEIIFSSDDEEYGSMIQGMYDGGYILVQKVESSLTSSDTFYGIMNCYKNFVYNWTNIKHDRYRVFNYYGNGVFGFLDEYDSNSSVSAAFFNAETYTWVSIPRFDDYWDGVSARTLLTQPSMVAEESNGWIMVEEEPRAYTNMIAVSTKDGIAYNLDSAFDYDISGVYGDNAYVLASLDSGDNVSGLAYFDTDTGEIVSVDYEYVNLIEKPENLFVDTINSTYVEIGLWPAYNMNGNDIYGFNDSIKSQSHHCMLRYSMGAMLLQLRGKDNLNYYALIDKQGNNIIEPALGDAIGTIGDGIFVVQVDGNYHILNQNGEEIFTDVTGNDLGYDSIQSVGNFYDGIAQFKMLHESGWVDTVLIDTDGNVVFSFGETIVKEIAEVGV